MRKNLVPVTIAGISFDALVDETKTLTSTIPVYPVESGFPVSDTIINDPISIQLTLYVSNTPVTWLYRHGSSGDRVKRICQEIENLWLSKQLVKIVTTDSIYTDMGLSSISIRKTREIGYAREIVVSAQKIRITSIRTADIPAYILQSGATYANAGTASATTSGNGNSSGSSNAAGNSGSSGGNSIVGRAKSILYGVASGLNFIK